MTPVGSARTAQSWLSTASFDEEFRSVGVSARKRGYEAQTERGRVRERTRVTIGDFEGAMMTAFNVSSRAHIRYLDPWIEISVQTYVSYARDRWDGATRRCIDANVLGRYQEAGAATR